MIPKDDGSKRTLSYEGTNRTWKWSQREDHKKILEAKTDMKARGVESPDDMDALACTFEVKNPPFRPKRRAPGMGPSAGSVRIAQGVGANPVI